MADETVLLRGGSRDGETTTRDASVRRLLAASPAPGLLEVYEETEQREGDAVVFEFAGTESADGINPQLIHMQVVGREGED
jgi:hypothetical protein